MPHRSVPASIAALLPAMVLCIALTPSPAEAQRYEGSFQRTLTVTGPADIEVVSGSGQIEVRAGASGRIEVSARIVANDGWGRWRSGLSPQERVKRIEANPPVEQTGNVVRIGVIRDEDLQNNVSISYTLTVPAASSLRSKTGSGSHTIEGLSGEIVATAGSGSITLTSLGGDVRASTGSGSVKAEEVRGGLHATTGSGGIRATGVAGRITAKTGSGSIEVAQSGSGDVELSSGSGSIRARGIRGGLQASTASGSLTAEGELAADWRLSSSSGSVRIGLPATQPFDLDASSTSGRIETNFPVTVSGTIGRHSLRGAAHGGGPMLRVRTTSGGIAIQGT